MIFNERQSGRFSVYVGWMFLLIFLLVIFTDTEAETEPPLRLTVKECISMALENNLDVSVERLNPLLESAHILSAKGVFDPTLAISPSYGETVSPFDARDVVAAGGLHADQSRATSIGSQLSGVTPWSTRYNLFLNTSNTENTFNSFEPQYSSDWGLTITQPLLKGFGPENQMFGLRVARKQRDVSRQAFIQRIIDVITTVKTAYYELVFALDDERVQMQALNLAAKLLQENKERVEIGTMTPLEVDQAEAAVASREVNIIVANKNVHAKLNVLRSLIFKSESKTLLVDLEPTELPTDTLFAFGDFEDLVSRAFEHRPDYQTAKLVLERNNLQLLYEKNQRFPQLDLRMTYGFNGLGEDFPKSINTDANKWSVGVLFSMPLPDRTAYGNLRESQILQQQAILRFKQTEQRIILQVDDALRAMEASYKLIKATRISTAAAEKVLQAENDKLEAGITTSYDVLRFQQDFINAKSTELRVLSDYNIEKANFFRTQGTTLLENQIEVDNQNDIEPKPLTLK